MAKKKEVIDVLSLSVKKVPLVIAGKLQMIAGIKGLTQNEIYNLAFEKYVKRFESKYGKIPLIPAPKIEK